jgi:hypothetical protein
VVGLGAGGSPSVVLRHGRSRGLLRMKLVLGSDLLRMKLVLGSGLLRMKA